MKQVFYQITELTSNLRYQADNVIERGLSAIVLVEFDQDSGVGLIRLGLAQGYAVELPNASGYRKIDFAGYEGLEEACHQRHVVGEKKPATFSEAVRKGIEIYDAYVSSWLARKPYAVTHADGRLQLKMRNEGISR